MPTILLSLDFARHILLRSKGLATWTLFDHDSSILSFEMSSAATARSRITIEVQTLIDTRRLTSYLYF